MATYATEIQYGGPNAPWRADRELEIVIKDRDDVIGSGPPPTGTQVSWSSPNGNGNVTFFDEGVSFSGSAQFPSEGPVGYRGQLKS